MDAIIRNFRNVLKRFKLASFLNIAGLSVAFAAFLIIMMQLQYEWTFDKMHPNYDKIYRVDMPRFIEPDIYASILTRGFADKVFESSPHIKKSALMCCAPLYANFTVGDGVMQKGYKEYVTTCYPDFVHVFGFTMYEGDIDCLKNPEKVLIPESMSKRMFGNETAIGKELRTDDHIFTKDGFKIFTVGGVYKDFPLNTQLNNNIYTQIDKTFHGDWQSMNFFAYVLLDSSDSKEITEKTVNNAIDYIALGRGEDTRMELVPLTDLYYKAWQVTDIVKVGNPNTSKLLFVIAWLVMIIACINFINFSTSLAPLRMKSINTQKVLGSSASSLRIVLVIEAIGITLFACLIAFLIVTWLDTIKVFSFMPVSLNLLDHLDLAIIVLVISIVLGFISGLYPAWYMTSFPPALVLKGSFGLSPSGRKLRTGLIAFQYVVSIALIIFTFFVQLQNRYIRTYDLGYNKEQLAVVDIGTKFYEQSRDIYKQKLKAYPEIEDVAFSSHAIGRFDTYSSTDMYYKEQSFFTNLIFVSWNFLQLMNIPVIIGKDFSEHEAGDSTIYYIYNKEIQSELGMTPGDYLDNSGEFRGKINGFFDKVKLSSLRYGDDRVAFLLNGRALNGSTALPFSYIRITPGADMQKAAQYIRNTIAEIQPTLPVNIEFYDDFYSNLYKKEETLNKLITSFSLLAIILSVVGVFGLVVFETQYRRKEIGIRKVFGATLESILIMFNKTYLRIIIVCFIIGTPVAYYLVSKWLNNFAYHIPMYWWVFVMALFIVLFITLLTVNYQNWRAANANPVDSIKSE